MTPGDDERWWDALAGRTQIEDDNEQRLIEAVRQAHEQDAALARLLERVERESALDAQDGSVTTVDFQRPSAAPTTPQTKHNPLYAIAANALLLGGVLVLAYEVSQYNAPPPWARDGMVRSDLQPQEIAVDNPQRVSASITDRLRELDIPVDRYRYRRRWIVEATAVGFDVPAVNVVLAPYGLAVPADGQLLLSFGSGG